MLVLTLKLGMMLTQVLTMADFEVGRAMLKHVKTLSHLLSPVWCSKILFFPWSLYSSRYLLLRSQTNPISLDTEVQFLPVAFNFIRSTHKPGVLGGLLNVDGRGSSNMRKKPHTADCTTSQKPWKLQFPNFEINS